MWKESESVFWGQACILEFAMHLYHELVLSQCSFYTLFLYKVSNVLEMHMGMYIYSEYQKSMSWKQFL